MSILPLQRRDLICPRCASEFRRSVPTPIGYFVLASAFAVVACFELIQLHHWLFGISSGLLAVLFAVASWWNIVTTRYGRPHPCPNCNYKPTVDQHSALGEKLRGQISDQVR